MSVNQARADDAAVAPAAGRAGRPGVALAVIAACQLMVVLDAAIVTIANPHIQTALGFTTADLSWVVNAYTLAFGGLLLLGGRIGDILGLRRTFMAGIALFTVASMLAGLAQAPWELLSARALQGAGAAVASPTALALITTNFQEGPPRNRALGVYAGVSGGGGAIGLLAGGMLTQWLDWRWVFFVNLPIGLLILLLAPASIAESPRRPGRFDVIGALTSTAGVSALVYGFIRASDHGWRDAWTLGAFGAAVVLLAGFFIAERTAPEPITPLGLFADRNRAGSYITMLTLGATLLGMFFFNVLFIQNVLGFGPIKAGFAFMPTALAILVAAGAAQPLLPRLGPKPFLVGGTALTTAAMVRLAQIKPTSHYNGGLLGPAILFGLGLGATFITLTLTAVSGIPAHQAGAASGLLNAMQQVGGALGLSVLVTLFGTAAGHEGKKQVGLFMAQATDAQRGAFAKSGMLPPRPWGDAVLTHGISTAFWGGAGLILLGLLTSIFFIAVRRSDVEALSGMAMGGGGG